MEIPILLIKPANDRGWRDVVGPKGEIYNIGPDKFTDAEVAAANEAQKVDGELNVVGDKTYLNKPSGTGGGKGGGKPWTPPPAQWEKFSSFAASYAAEYVIKPMIETHAIQEEFKDVKEGSVEGLISMKHRKVAKHMCETMIQLHKLCQEELG